MCLCSEMARALSWMGISFSRRNGPTTHGTVLVAGRVSGSVAVRGSLGAGCEESVGGW